MNEVTATPDHILYLEEIPSTNDFLNALVQSSDSPLSNGFVVSSQYQSSGRGQVGNHWHSEKNKNLLFSLLLYPDFIKAKDQFYISKAISVAIVKTLRALFPDQSDFFKIKWPNDIYFNDSKLAGILIENLLVGEYISNTIVGIGLNVEETHFPANLPNPISLRIIAPDVTVDKESLLRRLRHSILMEIERLRDDAYYDQLSEQYLQMLYRYNLPSPFSDSHGEFVASIVDVHPDGKLLLQTEKGENRLYYFKEVEYKFK